MCIKIVGIFERKRDREREIQIDRERERKSKRINARVHAAQALSVTQTTQSNARKNLPIDLNEGVFPCCTNVHFCSHSALPLFA